MARQSWVNTHGNRREGNTPRNEVNEGHRSMEIVEEGAAMASGEPKALRAGEGRALRVLGNTFTFKVAAADTNDTYAVFEIASPPNPTSAVRPSLKNF